jgi:hypothetical protein
MPTTRASARPCAWSSTSSRSRIRRIKNVEREYFYAVHGADDATRRGYLERAYALGIQF